MYHSYLCFKQARSRCTGLYSPLTQGRWVSFFSSVVLFALAGLNWAHHVYFPLFQPDELYFEEGDILYISDTVSLWSGLEALLVPPVIMEMKSIIFMAVFVILNGVFRVTVTGGREHAGEGLDLFPAITVRKQVANHQSFTRTPSVIEERWI